MPGCWVVYVLVSGCDGRTYVGVTTDLDRRLAQHNGERRGGARATRRGRPWRVGSEFGPFENRAEAQRVEREVKRLRGAVRLGPRASAVALS